MISQDRWPGDPGRKQKFSSRKIPGPGTVKKITLVDSMVDKNLNLSVAGPKGVSTVDGHSTPTVTMPSTTSLGTANKMTGPSADSSAVITIVASRC